jgi:hypothetical protein
MPVLAVITENITKSLQPVVVVVLHAVDAVAAGPGNGAAVASVRGAVAVELGEGGSVDVVGCGHVVLRFGESTIQRATRRVECLDYS